MPHPIPYLSFNGRCADAMRFYERALNGKLELLLRNADTPMAAHTPPEYADRIVHARNALAVDGKTTMPLQPMFWASINGELKAIYAKG